MLRNMLHGGFGRPGLIVVTATALLVAWVPPLAHARVTQIT
jgi:hypothetical protein